MILPGSNPHGRQTDYSIAEGIGLVVYPGDQTGRVAGLKSRYVFNIFKQR